MKICDICIQGEPARAGMTVREVFALCAEAGLPAVPYLDGDGRPGGWVSLRHTMTRGCIPEYIVELAEVLGDSLHCLEDSEQKIANLLAQPIEPFVLTPLRSVSPQAPVIKAVAIMEKYKASYLFVFDGDAYCGTVTTTSLARRMLDVGASS